MIRRTLRLSALLVTLALSSRQVRADYLYTVSGLPTPTVSGQSIVVFTTNPAPNHALSGTATADLALGNIIGFSANTGAGDHFHTAFTLMVDFADPAHAGSSAIASFAGILDGTLGSTQSSLFLQFSPASVNIDLAGSPYAISLPVTPILVPGNGSQTPFGVHIQSTGAFIDDPSAPEPSALLLAAFGLPLLGVLRRRKRLAAQSGRVGVA